MCKLIFFISPSHVEEVKQAEFSFGGRRIEAYLQWRKIVIG